MSSVIAVVGIFFLSDEDPPYTEGELFIFRMKESTGKDTPTLIQPTQRGQELLANKKQEHPINNKEFSKTNVKKSCFKLNPEIVQYARKDSKRNGNNNLN